MSTTITKIPDLNPVRNPVQVRLHGTGAVTVIGYQPDFTIDVMDSPPPSLQQMTLTFGSTDVHLIQQTTPSAVDGEYDGATDADLATSLKEALDLNYFISTHFIVTQPSSTQVRLYGIDTGTEFGLTGAAITINTSPQIFAISPYGPGGTTGIDEEVEPNYGLLMQLWVEDIYLSDTFDLKLEQVLGADASFYGYDDISRALRAYVDPFMPAYNMSFARRMAGAFKRFLVRASETFGDPAEVQGMVTTEKLHCHLAGRSEVMRVAIPEWEDQVQTGVDDLWAFLTNWPNNSAAMPKRVQPSQREFLSVVVLTAFASIKLRAQIWYTDYTTAENVLLNTYTGEDEIVRGEMVMFAVGVDVNDLNSFVPTKTIDRFAVWLTDNLNNVISERRYYVVDREKRDHYRQFHYLNTPGGVDTLALFGARSEEQQPNMQRTSRYVPNIPADNADARDNSDVLEGVNIAFEIGTEHLNQDEMEAMRDLLTSERVVERVARDNWPVQFLETKMKTANEAEGRQPLRLKYRYALRNTANTLNA